MDCSQPGSSDLDISQARILDRLSFPPPGGLLNPGIKPTSPALAGEFFNTDPLGKPWLKTLIHFSTDSLIIKLFNIYNIEVIEYSLTLSYIRLPS